MNRKKIDPDKCNHVQAEELGQGWQEIFGKRIYLMHYHCEKCGLMFARELRGKK